MKEIYKKAIDKFGKKAQIFMLFEEIGELLQAISKYDRNKSFIRRIILIDEIADVEIMLGQMRVLFNCDEEVEKIKSEKIIRLANLLKVKQ